MCKLSAIVQRISILAGFLLLLPMTGTAEQQWFVGKEAAGKMAQEHRLQQLSAELDKEGYVIIPAGSFQMGDIQGVGNSDERPVHTVQIRAFAMGKYEVTFEQYDAFCLATNRKKVSARLGGAFLFSSERGNHPVINANWDGAQAYARWMSEQMGKRFRLPTEAEWEYAARAGSSTKYSWGNEIGTNKANCNACGSKWDNRNVAPVGSFQPNAFGLYDMHGNVREWVADCFNDSYNGAPSDGSAWLAGACRNRVMRGGSWYHTPWSVRSAFRVRGPANVRLDRGGFRLVQELD